MIREKLSGLTKKIVLAMLLGAIFGILAKSFLSSFPRIENLIIFNLLELVGSLFISSLKMLVVPLVFVSLVSGIGSLRDLGSLGKLGARTLMLYLLTTGVAVSVGLLLADIFEPGKGLNLADAAGGFELEKTSSLMDVLTGIIPDNPVAAMAEGNMLQIIVFSILFGIGASASKKYGRKIFKAFDSLNAIVTNIIFIIMSFAPYGVFCLIGKAFYSQGHEVIVSMAEYVLVVIAAYLFHALGVFSFLIKYFCKLDPLIFFKKMRQVQIFAFSTSSSNATIPINLDTVVKKLGVKKSVASFTIPLGATINMDGTAIMQGVATVFIANAYGLDLALSQYFTIVLTAMLASIGTAGVPGVGLVMLAMVLEQVGLPVEGIGLIIGVDRILDMLRTAINVTGDAAVSTVVAIKEKSFDYKVFNNTQK
jgi:Na+/H+-dicarboxylate symporter